MSSQGRVELFYNGTWGTVCGDNWKLRDANVLCNQLGFGGAHSALIMTQTVFGRGKGNIWYFQLRCIGNESSLTDCGQGVWYSSSCSYHSYDAGVVCRTGTKSYKTVNLFILFCHLNFIMCKKYLSQDEQANKNKHSLVSILSISSFGGRTAIPPRRTGTSLLQQDLGLGVCWSVRQKRCWRGLQNDGLQRITVSVLWQRKNYADKTCCVA